jgi:predicted outer membrane repeat protein
MARKLLVAMVAAIGATSIVGLPLIGAPVVPANAVLNNWLRGLSWTTTVTNCASVADNMPYQQTGIDSYLQVGPSVFSPSPVTPLPGETYSISVKVTAVGSPCDVQKVRVELQLPPNTTAGAQGLCVPPNSASYICNTPTLPSGRVWAPNVATGDLWELSPGQSFEVRFSVQSSVALTNSPATAHLLITDGNENPVATPSIGVNVFSSSTGSRFVFNSPSTEVLSPTSASMSSYRYLTEPGNLFFDFGSSPALGNTILMGAVAAGAQHQNVMLDSTAGLVPGTTYYWRHRFVSATNVTTVSSLQSFTTQQAGSVRIGNGTPGSCTDAALRSELGAIDERFISFNCGLLPHTIDLVGALPVGCCGKKTVLGGNRITLRSPANANVFAPTGTNVLELRDLTLTSQTGPSPQPRLQLSSSSKVIADRVRFVGPSTSENGGAVVLSNSSQFEGIRLLFRSNVTGSNGGAIRALDSSTVTIGITDFSQNSASAGSGGAIYADTNATVSIERSLFSSNAAYLGGAIRAQGDNVDVRTSTFSGNSAQFGGAILGPANPSQSLLLRQSTVTANSSGLDIDSDCRLEPPVDCSQGAIDGRVSLQNTIVSGNSSPFTGGPADCAFHLGNTPPNLLLSTTGNLVGSSTCFYGQSGFIVANPALGPLAQNRGPTRTHGIQPTSPAFKAGNDASCSSCVDQRGFLRAPVLDIGAFEFKPEDLQGPDTTNPTVSISTPSVNQVVSGTPVTISGVATDNVAVTSVRVAIYRSVAGGQYWNGTAWQPANTSVAATLLSGSGSQSTSWTYTFNAPPGGVFGVAALAYDAANNYSIAPYQNFSISDTTVPTVSLTSPTPSQAFPGRPVTITGTATDNAGVGDVQIAVYRAVDPGGQFWNGTSWQSAYTTVPATLGSPGAPSTTYTYSFNPPQSGGYYYAAAIALDTSYRYNLTPFTLFTLPDTSAPTATVTTPAAGPTTGQITVTGTANDNSSINRVSIALYREATGQYWNGTGWQTAFTTFTNATLTNPGATTTPFSATVTPPATGRLYIGALPVDGNYNYTLTPWRIVTAS